MVRKMGRVMRILSGEAGWIERLTRRADFVLMLLPQLAQLIQPKVNL